jgi:hypothetical protein
MNEERSRFDLDFWLTARGREFGFQLTEVQEPGRRRGHESRRPDEKPTRPFLEAVRRGRSDAPSWIRNGVQRKVDRYRAAGADLNLLVVLPGNAGAGAFSRFCRASRLAGRLAGKAKAAAP